MTIFENQENKPRNKTNIYYPDFTVQADNAGHLVVNYRTKLKLCYFTIQGDSGGPLVVNNGTNRFVLVGATSFGVATCEGPYPSMFAR